MENKTDLIVLLALALAVVMTLPAMAEDGNETVLEILAEENETALTVLAAEEMDVWDPEVPPDHYDSGAGDLNQNPYDYEPGEVLFPAEGNYLFSGIGKGYTFVWTCSWYPNDLSVGVMNDTSITWLTIRGSCPFDDQFMFYELPDLEPGNYRAVIVLDSPGVQEVIYGGNFSVEEVPVVAIPGPRPVP